MRIRHFFLAWALTVGLASIPAQALGQTFNLLHTFTAVSNGTNTDGSLSYATLALSGNTLYGTTFNGGAASNGTVFAVNTDGTGFTKLHTFTARLGLLHTNNDGAQCIGGVILFGKPPLPSMLFPNPNPNKHKTPKYITSYKEANCPRLDDNVEFHLLTTLALCSPLPEWPCGRDRFQEGQQKGF